MYKCTQFLPIFLTLFDDPKAARKASRITTGVTQGCSLRLSDIAREMVRNEATNHKMVQRFFGK